MGRLGNVHRNAKTIFVKLAQTALCHGKVLLSGELHPIKGDNLVLRYATAAQVANSQ